MFKTKINRLFMVGASILLISCNGTDNADLAKTVNDVKDGQQVILKKLSTLEKTIANISVGNKSNKKDQPPKADPNKVYNIEVGDSYTMGPDNAKVTMIEWTDFQWPHCARSVSLIDDLHKKYPNDLRIVVKQFPLSFHKQARKASLYALAAERQGKYHEMSNKIFENYRNLKSNEDLPRQYAEELGLDMVKFDKDMQDPALDARITKEMNQMRQSGIPRLSVPKFLINGKEPQGGRDVANYSSIIDAELKKKK